MGTEKQSFIEKLNSKWVTPLFAIITIVYGFMIKVNRDNLQNNTTKLNDKLHNLSVQIETELRVKEFDNKLKMTIYGEVKDALKQKDSSLQNATLIVINEMLKDDTIFREKLKTVLFASANSKQLISVQQKIDQFSSEQTAVEQTPSNSNGFKIDVFYLDDIIGEAKPRAEKIVKLLQEKYTKYNVRLRLLPKEINAQSGYRIDANQIRYESKESEISKNVLSYIKEQKIFSKEQPRLNLTNSSTPNYISIFVRNM